MKPPSNEELFIIADCLEEDYNLYKPLYKKLAKINHIDPRNIYILTDKRIRNLKMNKLGQPFEWMNDVIFMKLLIQSYKEVYVVSDVKRSLHLSKYLSNEQMNNIQLYGYYANITLAREHPLSKVVAKHTVVLSNSIICMTSLLPDKEYLDNLDNVIKYVRANNKRLIKKE